MSAESSILKRPRILNCVKGKLEQAAQEELSADLQQQLAVFGVAGMVIGPIIGSLDVAIWQSWASAVDEARGENQVPTVSTA